MRETKASRLAILVERILRIGAGFTAKLHLQIGIKY
jgi:hypothetical protein